MVDRGYHSPPDNQWRRNCHLCQKTAFIDQPILVSSWIMDNVSYRCCVARLPAHLVPRDVRENSHSPLNKWWTVYRNCKAQYGWVAPLWLAIACCAILSSNMQVKCKSIMPWHLVKKQRNICWNFLNNVSIHASDLTQKNLKICFLIFLTQQILS